MRLFRKPRKDLSDGQLRTAEKIAAKILAVQRSFANWLNSKTGDLHPKTWLFLLICFCAGFGAYLIRLVIQLFN